MTGALARTSPSPARPSDGRTIGDLLGDVERTLRRAGIGDARREAVTMLGAVAGQSAGAIWARRDRPADPDLAAAFAAAAARRAAGTPAAYAVGSAAFRTLELAVGPAVLIPRPETEGLVEHVLQWCGRRGRWGTAVDVGTGSGCIALSLAVEGAFAGVIATDVSAQALATARRNAAAVRPATPLDFRAGDLLWPVREQVDVIVSNPPYVAAAEWDGLEPSVREHEPRLALVSGADGMAHTAALLRLAPARLREGGLLALELDCRRADRVLALAVAGGWHARVERDLFGRERYLLATREDQ